MGNYGIKVSKEGYDVKTATSDQLVMSSKFNMFKVFATGNLSITKSGTAWEALETSVTHNLGYYPAYLGYWVDTSSGNRKLLGPNCNFTDDVDVVACDVDTTKLYCRVYTNIPDTYNFRYYILLETAQ